MKLQVVVRFVFTIAIFATAIFTGKKLWDRYMDSPWTRDAKVRADVVNVAADVSGLVDRVAVKDNQLVHKGDLLFVIDRERYALALSQAKARLSASRAQMGMKQQEAERRARVDVAVVSVENRENARSQADAAEAACQEAAVAVETAELNLKRTEVRSPVDGYIANLNVHRGDFASAGAAKLAIVDKNSFWVYGYFEETKIRLLHVGAPVEIRLLASDRPLKGHVESLARGISDHDNPVGRELLSDVNPIFNWVRLAQRVPVRIAIDNVPKSVQLVAGTTCTVIAKPRPSPPYRQATM
ncbi:efflux RND transporter periplasmic adaptor subunit [Geomonas azotofigens]|uniref:efflux RND transporter periplasmic adaptor subunit n=1 Tax=Geomonas azotofigens TaxID=2843196 RepID=UPI001C0FD3EF|nr:efflux RND transporter periplasmic adaptor subunit [Geomonas azotofigens]MBU5613908.1 efflux RND transporter periplasmic adaptor subunit [Geomonas azotofigens]